MAGTNNSASMTLFEIAELYRTAMRARGIKSDVELAEKTGLSLSTITKMMAGDVSVGKKAHRTVCVFLGVVVEMRIPEIGKGSK